MMIIPSSPGSKTPDTHQADLQLETALKSGNAASISTAYKNEADTYQAQYGATDPNFDAHLQWVVGQAGPQVSTSAKSEVQDLEMSAYSAAITAQKHSPGSSQS